jgi:murein L,D-transpeptidase YafK
VWSFALIGRSLVRALITSAALAAGVLLAGCNSDEVSLANNAKANQPVPPKLLAAMTEKDMDLQSPILIRLFKEEAELEVWKQDRSGHFALLKTYPICRWSGDLGPRGLLCDLACADEPAIGVLSFFQHGLPERVRQVAGTYRV